MDIAQKRSGAELRWQRKCLWRKRNCLQVNESGTKEENNEMLGLECSTVLYAAEMWTLTQTDRRRLEAFEMWIWRRMEKISWRDKVTNEEVLRRVNEDRQILNCIWQRKHRWIGHVLRHDGLLHEFTEDRMKGKPTRGRRRIQMLQDLANDGGFVALKRAAEDRQVWRQRKDVKNLLCSRRLLM